MRFEVLGPLRATVNGEEVALGPPRQQTLLAVLLLHRDRVISATRLVEAVWVDEPDGVAPSTLHAYVSRLRRLLRHAGSGRVALETRRPGYVLYLDEDSDLDAARFEQLAGQGRSALARGDPHGAASTLADALTLWRGPALDGLAEDSDLLAAEAARLEELRLTALEDRVRADLARGRHDEVISELESLVASYPFREQLWGHLIVARYRAGRQADALATYRRAKEHLAEHLGIDPSQELQRLHQRILRQDPALAPPAPSGPAVVAPSFRLPASRDTPLGREEDVGALRDLLARARLVTVTGPGGAGKTTVALYTARLLEREFAEGAALVDLASVEDQRDVGAAVLAALGGDQHAGESGLAAVVRTLGSRDALLLLDNCEHVLGAAAELADAVLSACPHVRVLATTRCPLGVRGERWWPLSPLPVPPEGADSAEAAASPAVSLLVQRAQAVDPRFRLDDQAVEVATRIVSELDGLPLAIELAATRVTSLTLEEIAAHLDDRFRLLRGGPRSTDTRQQTLENAIAWSERLLDEPDRVTLARLAALPGGADRDTARAVVFDADVDGLGVANALDGLVRKSLLVADRAGGRTRYRMLETVRAYFLQRLEATEGSHKTRHRLADYLREVALEASRALRGPDPASSSARLDAELTNLLAVRNWALGQGDPGLLFEVVTALPLVAEWRIRPQLYDVMETAADAAEDAGHPEWPAVAAATAVSMSVRGDPDRARRQLAVALDRLPGDHSLRPVAWLFRVHVAVMVGETEAGVQAARACLHEPATVTDGFLETFAHSCLAMALATAGRREEAGREFARLRPRQDARDSPALAAWCAYVHGEVLGDDRPEEAKRHYEQAIDLGRRSGVDAVTGVALIGLCSLEGRHGAAQRALPAFSEALTHHLEGSRWQMCWTALDNLTELLTRVGRHEAALEILGAADVSRTCPPVYGEAARRRVTVVARAEAALGAQTAADARDRGAQRDEAATVRAALATIARARADPESADPESADPESADPESADPESAGPPRGDGQ